MTEVGRGQKEAERDTELPKEQIVNSWLRWALSWEAPRNVTVASNPKIHSLIDTFQSKWKNATGSSLSKHITMLRNVLGKALVGVC